VFGRRKKSVTQSLDDISGSLADVESARRSAQAAAARAAKAAENAEQKAIRAAGKEQQKADSQAKKAADGERKADLRSAKALATQAKKADKNAKAAAKNVPLPLLSRVTDPKAARRALTVAKVVGPVIAPFALKAATSTREYLDNRRAHRLGVAAAEVGAYRGRTGSAEARLSGLKRAIDDVRSRRAGDLQVTRFADVASGRITDLTAAVRAAASMPAGRRRGTVSAVNRELDQIDADLMTFLVGR
jgi:membrane protein involved in colicin uptake